MRKICGKRDGRNFKDAIRPFLYDGSCPDGFEPCHPISETTQAFNSTFSNEFIESTTCVEIGQ